MRRKSHRAAAAIAIFAFSGCAVKPKTHRAGILSGSDAFLKVSEGFRAKMADPGCVEGRNILHDMHALNADSIAEPRIARKFVSEKIDLIPASPTEPAIPPAGEIFTATPVSRLRLNHRLARELKLSVSESTMRMANEVKR